ncbi:hypothetical protein [Pseudalkalibacillus decolorationis]|uniref:hypothetical protein n=1 Tax=Pseudalkalibacillus decolorationis TaxID=163879 RepID=UPI00214877C6|nr:hypothetical protein [Pseudalkalibacillus decolorationis]
MSEQAYVKVVRGNEFYALLRKYQIIIDGEQVGEIPRAKEMVFDVNPGVHTISSKIDWVESETVEFELTHGETIAFRFTGKGLNAFVTLIS